MFLFVQVVDEGEVVQRLQERGRVFAGVFCERFGVQVFFPPRRDEEPRGEQAGVAAQVEQEFDEHLAAFVRRGRGLGGQFPGGGDEFTRGGVGVVFLGADEPGGVGGVHGVWWLVWFTYGVATRVYVNYSVFNAPGCPVAARPASARPAVLVTAQGTETRHHGAFLPANAAGRARRRRRQGSGLRSRGVLGSCALR